jgi:ABC-type enterochelin transport system permease subunit
MKARLGSIIGWIATGLLVLSNAFALVMKFIPVAPGSEAELMGQRLGTAGLEYGLGVLEGIILVLFIVPRTSLVGFVLMIGYLGGATATQLTHGMTQTELVPMYITLGVLALCGWFRFPEMTARLRGKTV